jgi:acyl carrier protein
MRLTEDAVRELVRRVFLLPPTFNFSPELRPAFIPGWDSFGWMRILLEIEQMLSCEVPVDLFDRVVTVDDFCNVLVEFSHKTPSQ